MKRPTAGGALQDAGASDAPRGAAPMAGGEPPHRRDGRRAALRITALAALALSCAAPPVLAQEAWPTKPIRFVVPYPPGGPLDQVARVLAEKLRDPLGQPVIVENRAGAGGNLGADLVAKSPADGHTLVMGAVATHAINPALFAKMPYDANRDFAPVTRIALVPNVLVMNTETAGRLGIQDVAGLIAHARRNPGRLNYASGGNGSAGHLAGELFKSMAGVSMVHIPYQGAAPAQLGLMAGQTDLMFDNLASAAAQIRAGKLKGFAVTTTARSGFFPELPTVAEAGVPGFEYSSWTGLLAPARTPLAVVTRLHAESVRAVGTPEMRNLLAAEGAEPVGSTPEQFASQIRVEVARWGELVRTAKIRAD